MGELGYINFEKERRLGNIVFRGSYKLRQASNGNLYFWKNKICYEISNGVIAPKKTPIL